ncbi:MAG: ABC transporter ATP-binding protein [Clostridia bacterium]|nr:ABC transporter ATP-binding protein [Clostridia bacterium]MBR4576587.1 ABC transporter ATP-binding protein [Clostridia bacterium]
MKFGSGDISKFKRIFKSPALGQVIRWSRCVHSRIIWICILNVVSVLLSLGMTLVTKALVDAAVSSHIEDIWKYGIALVAVTLLMIAISFSLSLLRTKASAMLQRHLQGMMVQDILTKKFATLKGYHSGELVNRVFSDTAVVRNGVLSILPWVISTVVSFVGAASILIALDWRFVLLLAVVGVIGFILVLLFRKPMKQRHKRMHEAEDKLHSSIQETLENIRLIKASISEKRVFRQIDSRQATMEKEQIRQGRFSAVMNNSLGVMFEISWLFCMLWGCAAIYRGEMTYGSLAAMLQLIGRVQGPIASAVGIATEVYGVIASAERLMELTELPSETTGETLKDFDSIELDHVTFRYEDGTEDVLRDISGTIRKGEFVALTGTSGGGKTSLFQLLLGIYSPNAGSVCFMTGKDRTEACRESRSLFAYVPQGNTLFSGTLRENVLMFTDTATDEEIMTAMRAACIDDLAEEVGLDAELGERGVGISEGQAQRVAVARALLTGAPILLLDESTSALDEETEARMLKNISAMREKTVLIVTHRRAALSICDYRLHISNGSMEKKAALLNEQEDPCITTESRK